MILKQHMEVHNAPDTFTCTVCGVGAKTKRNLNHHMVSVHGELKFKCEKCDKAFSMNRHLLRHIACHHSDVPARRYPCGRCDKTFLSTTFVKYHQIDKHGKKFEGLSVTAAKAHQCDQCDYKTSFQRNLTSHIERVHLKLRLECEKCGKQFKMASYLQTHESKCEGTKETKPKAKCEERKEADHEAECEDRSEIKTEAVGEDRKDIKKEAKCESRKEPTLEDLTCNICSAIFKTRVSLPFLVTFLS